MIAITCPRCSVIIFDDRGESLDDGINCPTCFAAGAECKIPADYVRAHRHILADHADESDSAFEVMLTEWLNESNRKAGNLSRVVDGRLIRERQMRLNYGVATCQ